MPDADANALLQAVFDAGVTFWDTAEAYICPLPDGSTKYNETVLGDAIKALGLPRDQLQLATKIMPSLHGKTMTAESCIAACQASCDRLGVASVDLYYVHRVSTHPHALLYPQYTLNLIHPHLTPNSLIINPL